MSNLKKNLTFSLLISLIPVFSLFFRSEVLKLKTKNSIYILRKRPGEVSSKQINAEIISLSQSGPKVWSQVLENFMSSRDWGPESLQFAQVFRIAGAESKKVFFDSLNNNRSDIERFRCIWMMQESFHDFSRFQECLESLQNFDKSVSNWQREESAFQLQNQLESYFQEGVPKILSFDKNGKVTNNISYVFRDWEKKKNIK